MATGEYRVGHRQEETDRLSSRGAADNAAFFIPYLRAGMSLLDCGCGPGSITADLAEIVVPGRVTGVDPEQPIVDQARALASSRNLVNLSFEAADVHELPFEDGTFDAVFMHAVCEHLKDVPGAFAEVRRVLKPGGVFGVRSGDIVASLLWPDTLQLRGLWEICDQVYRRDGRCLAFGRRQLSVLREAGFRRIVTSASYDVWSRTPDAKRVHAELVQSVYTSSWIVDQAIAQGIADRASLDEVVAAWGAWADDPDGFMAEPRAEAVAWKD